MIPMTATMITVDQREVSEAAQQRVQSSSAPKLTGESSPSATSRDPSHVDGNHYADELGETRSHAEEGGVCDGEADCSAKGSQ